MKNIKKPKQLESYYSSILQIFENLENARKTVAAAQRCGDPSDAIYYRDALDKLVRLEAQVDSLTFVFQKSRAELKQWVADMGDYHRALEEKRRTA